MRHVLGVLGAFLLTSLLLVLVLPVHAQSADEVEYWAVIIGISDYAHFSYWQPPHDLAYPDDDARELYVYLSRYWGEDHTKILVDSDATKENIEAVVTGWLAPQVGVEDVVLFFFAGHACQCCGHNCLLPYDIPLDTHANSIHDTELDDWLSELKSDRLVVILDTCYAAGFFGDLGRAGRVILASCAENEESFDYTLLRHGVFSYYLLQGLDNLEAVDVNSDNEVSAEELFRYISPVVVEHSEGHISAQHPQLYDGYDGELVLFGMTSRGTGSISLPDQQGDSKILYYVSIAIVGGLTSMAVAMAVARARSGKTASSVSDDRESD